MDDTEKALGILKSRGVTGPVDAALVLGTGLGALAEALEQPTRIAYADLPGFPHSHVSGHAGVLHVGRLAGKRVLVLQGRNHYYEHGDPRAMRQPLAVIAALQARMLVLTNSAGSTQENIGPGAIVAISDHINFSGINPLIGEQGDRRFVPMSDAYDDILRQQLLLSAKKAGQTIGSGVYMWFSGPSFETPAEIRMARAMGADLVGMSTVPEVILARYFGLRVVALSMVTNLAAGIRGANPTHEETKMVAGSAARHIQDILTQFLKDAPL